MGLLYYITYQEREKINKAVLLMRIFLCSIVLLTSFFGEKKNNMNDINSIFVFCSLPFFLYVYLYMLLNSNCHIDVVEFQRR